MNINELFSGFNENQLKQINDFLASAQNGKMAASLTAADKKRIMKQFNSLDPNEVKTKLSKLSANDIKRILNN